MSVPQASTAATCSSDGMLMHSSPVRRALRSVSFSALSSAAEKPMPTIGGVPEKPLKKLNGARLYVPVSFSVPTQAIGRGIMQEIMQEVAPAGAERRRVDMHACLRVIIAD